MVPSGIGPESAGGATGVAPARPGPRGLERLGRFMARHRWWVIGAWVLAVVALAAPAATLHDVYRDVFTVPGTNSQDSTNLLEQRFPSQQDPSASIVFAAKPGATLTDAADRTAVESVLATVEGQPGVAGVTDPFGSTPRVSAPAPRR